MKKNILVIINPKAGSSDAVTVSEIVKNRSKSLGLNTSFYYTTGKNDKQEIEQLIANNNFDRAIVAGGDGTINLVATIAVKYNIAIGILACGSANGLAASLELPQDINSQLEIAINNTVTSIDTLLINNNVCLHIADIGINAELIYNYETSQSRGMTGYLKQTIPTLFKSKYPYHFSISSEEIETEKKGVLLAFANAKKYGTGAVINPEGSIMDGSFEIILFKKLSLKAIAKSFLKDYSFSPTSVEIFKSRSVTVKSKTPIALQVDGEYIGDFEKFTAQIKPNSLRIALPNR
ncbi:MAG: diacylglycerol kinase [Winogradskyella sp.]|uniref:diacylglycerol/lipid kinase family protein n=1 Tax=Winogradskyella sp. TaxID=1883156 RepID=UPI0017B6CCD3|nr:diacylglycerol kinase [Winogradskyella sp.]